ncbi:MAG: hypothetical protein BroJett013_22450 [Alphaproteobacteria bacterium]|nr:MAG: hypothetical protein BroJett013_22450 [Alphaproteobacteria bacterium]
MAGVPSPLRSNQGERAHGEDTKRPAAEANRHHLQAERRLQGQSDPGEGADGRRQKEVTNAAVYASEGVALRFDKLSVTQLAASA